MVAPRRGVAAVSSGDDRPAWYGKLPTLGDFASRRLEPDFIGQWDAWLAGGMADLHERDGSDWIQRYLLCPSWCFVLMPGVLTGHAGASAWMGVLMPSVDRVGRYFPLTLVSRIPALPRSLQDLEALWTRVFEMDETCAMAIQDDWTVDQFEAALGSRHMTWAPVPGSLAHLTRAGDVLAIDITKVGGVGAAMGLGIPPTWADDVRGLAFWRPGGDPAQTVLLASRGLPASAAELLGWAAPGRRAMPTPGAGA